MITAILKSLLYFYKYFISLFLPRSCRFVPSCSEYSLEAIEKHGAVKGCFLTFKRIMSCHPLGSYGYNPVPEKFSIKDDIFRILRIKQKNHNKAN